MAARLTQREGSTVWSCGRGIRPDTGDNCPDLTGNTFYFKYFTRDTKFGTDHLSCSQEQGVSVLIPSQELVSFLPHVYLEDPRVASGSKGSPGSELAAVVWRRAVRSSMLHLCTMSHLWRCNRMLILL